MREIITNMNTIVYDLIMQNPYLWIFVFMSIESSFIPFPSEIVMIPAGYLASLGKINLYIAIFVGAIGSVVGALINYFIGYYGGPKLTRYLIGQKNFDICNNFFIKHGEKTQFFCRLLPVIRQVISIPAGIFKMRIEKFILFTFLGAFIWVAFLAYVGYFIGNNEQLLKQYKLYFFGGVVLILLLFIIIKYKFSKYLQKNFYKK